jgi:hypothetical protein
MKWFGPCTLEFVPDEGEPIVCDREGVHTLHEDYATGRAFKERKGGAIVIEPVRNSTDKPGA